MFSCVAIVHDIYMTVANFNVCCLKLKYPSSVSARRMSRHAGRDGTTFCEPTDHQNLNCCEENTILVSQVGVAIRKVLDQTKPSQASHCRETGPLILIVEGQVQAQLAIPIERRSPPWKCLLKLPSGKHGPHRHTQYECTKPPRQRSAQRMRATTYIQPLHSRSTNGKVPQLRPKSGSSTLVPGPLLVFKDALIKHGASCLSLTNRQVSH